LKLSRQAHENVPSDESDRVIMEHFLQGLDPSIQRFVMMSDPTSFEQAFRVAKREECHHKLTKSQHESSHICSTSCKADEIGTLQSKVNALTEKLDGISKRLDASDRYRRRVQAQFGR